MAKRVDYEERFYVALQRIAKAYMTPRQIRRESGDAYGLDYAEALEYSYENLQTEAKNALRGYRKPKAVPPPSDTKEK